METGRLAVEARPNSPRLSLEWDPWRSVWIVRVPEPPVRGAANEAIRVALARWIGVPLAQVRWVRAGAGRRKIAEVEGIGSSELDGRLRRAAARSGPGTRERVRSIPSEDRGRSGTRPEQ